MSWGKGSNHTTDCDADKGGRADDDDAAADLDLAAMLEDARPLPVLHSFSSRVPSMSFASFIALGVFSSDSSAFSLSSLWSSPDTDMVLGASWPFGPPPPRAPPA